MFVHFDEYFMLDFWYALCYNKDTKGKEMIKMKIKKTAPTAELIDALKLTFDMFYLPYVEKDTAQNIYDLRKAIFEELSRRNQEEFEKIS